MKRYLSLKKRPSAKNRAYVQGSAVHQNPKKERKENELAEKLNSWNNLK